MIGEATMKLNYYPETDSLYIIVKHIITWTFLSINLLGCAETEHINQRYECAYGIQRV